MASSYTDAEIDMIAGWLRQGWTSGQIAEKFSAISGRDTSRSAIVGLVSRNTQLKAVGFARPAKSPKVRESLWTEGAVETARKMWAQGASTREIGMTVGRSAAAVTSYAFDHRTQFPPRPKTRQASGSAGGTVTRMHNGIRSDKVAADLLPAPEAASRTYDAASRQLPLSELGWQDCRFAVNDAAPGEQHLFCGLPVMPGRSWCRHHLLRCIGSGTEAERRADRIPVRARAA
ncbi:MAG: GcrA family cell cycle regulator [Mesorhizobium sp.]